MTIEIRSVSENETETFVSTLAYAFGWDMDPEDTRGFARLLEPQRSFAAFDRESMVGTAAAFSFDLAVPGARARCAGVTGVGVLPSHRRQGLLREMMRRLLDQARERGEPLAALWASEEPIYQRFGFGLASQHGALEVDPHRVRFRDDDGKRGDVRLLDHDEALKVLPQLYESVMSTTPGMMSRTDEWWPWHVLRDSAQRRRAGVLYRAVWEADGRAQAYALFRRKDDWDDNGLPAGRVEVQEVIAVSPQAHREIWRFIFSLDLARTVAAWLVALDDPLLLMLQTPRRLQRRAADALWLRIVDVASALGARRYPGDGRLVFQVDDAFCPWNARRWRLEATRGTAFAGPSDDEADLRVEASDLGSVYLGGFTFAQLQRAGRLDELTPGAVDRADAMFRTGVQPWCPEIF